MSGGIAMLLGSWLPTTGIAIGASGGVFGLLAATLLLVFHYRAEYEARDRVLRGALITCLIVAITISFLPGVSFARHIGGFISGALTAPLIVRGAATALVNVATCKLRQRCRASVPVAQVWHLQLLPEQLESSRYGAAQQFVSLHSRSAALLT